MHRHDRCIYTQYNRYIILMTCNRYVIISLVFMYMINGVILIFKDLNLKFKYVFRHIQKPPFMTVVSFIFHFESINCSYSYFYYCYFLLLIMLL